MKDLLRYYPILEEVIVPLYLPVYNIEYRYSILKYVHFSAEGAK